MGPLTTTRIAHVISGAWSVGGAERIVAALVAGGEARGWAQLVLNPFSRPSSAAFAALCGERRYEGRFCDRSLGVPALRLWLRRRLAEFSPHVVHGHLFHGAVLLASLPHSESQRQLLTHHYGDWRVGGARGGPRQVLDRWAGSRFDQVVAVSDSVKRFLLDDYKYAPAKVIRIANGWDGDPGPPAAAQPVPTVVCVGLFRAEKGHSTLLSSFQLVRRELPDARLVLVGDGELRPALLHQIATTGLEGSVEMVGTVTDVWPYLAHADVFALASVSESFGMGIVEAMAAGLPVVAPAIGGIPELVRPGVNGELFPPGDIAALARHVIDLLRSPETRSQMGAAGRDLAQRFRMETMVQSYFELYENMLELSPSRARLGRDDMPRS